MPIWKQWTWKNLMLELQQEPSKAFIIHQNAKNQNYYYFCLQSTCEAVSMCSMKKSKKTQSCKQSCAPSSTANGGQGEVTLNRSLL